MTRNEVQELLRCSGDPWHFLTKHVWTQDPARGVARYPNFKFLRELISNAERERSLLVPKSRQMVVTWTVVAYFVWRMLFRGPGVFLFISRSERCAEEVLLRAQFILDRLPAYMQPKRQANSREEIALTGVGSRLLSLPAVPDAPRMHSPAGVFWDEMAFTPFDEQIWGALKPALESGGRFIGVSTSAGPVGLFYRLIQNAKECGLGIYKIHYRSHPERDEAWEKQARRGLSAQRWAQEMEISFESGSDLVYSEFDTARHILSEPWRVRTDWPLYRAIDFGYHHPFVLWIQETPQGDLIVFDEWAGQDHTTEQMLLAIQRIDLTHGIDELCVRWTACDPAGAAVQDSGISPADLLQRAGIKLKFRPSHIVAGIEVVKSFLEDAQGRVRLRFSPRCKKAIADISAYRWAAGREEPQKDGTSDHSMDALRYFLVNYQTRNDILITPRAFSLPR